ncbi:alpha/beta hydrolase [Acinetobacter baumannii]|uniref:alpha/beta hydrolase n=1 Tax=Acinetobacter baumannii TaxID=470 RepID=UPI0029343FDE|nr:alpha/beta hydrolase [Acinetobacter baumannii]WOE33952.1 alpha/beta hydrolase [Acinetobacter baumannii]
MSILGKKSIDNPDQANIGQYDASFMNMAGNVAETLVSTVANKLHPVIETYAQLFKTGVRTPVLRRPDEYGMQYEEIYFLSDDGVPLDGWFIPAESNKLLIINHPMTCNRYGFPGHLPPYNTMFGGFEVNFLPELKHLHDAGYNILTYDLRNCGLSGTGNGGISGLGLLESRDVIGSIKFVQSHPTLSNMELGIYSRCMGGNSTIIAMKKQPEVFKDVKVLVLLNVVSGRTFIEKAAEMVKADTEKMVEDFNERLRELTGFRVDEETPLPYAHAVKVPTMMAQLRRDFLIHAEKDGQEIFDALGTSEKELIWIEESNQRFYAYNHFGAHPEKLLEWLSKYL